MRGYVLQSQRMGFRYEAIFDLDSAEVVLESDEEATVTGSGRIADRSSGRPLWEFDFELQMRKADGDWLLLGSRADTTGGKRPF